MGVKAEYAYDFWNRGPTGSVEVDCLMPNGVLIPLNTSVKATFSEIKEDLWEQINKYPLQGMLHDMSVYVFACNTFINGIEQVLDENRRLCDVKPNHCILRVTECKGEKTDIFLTNQISHLIGKGVHEFKALKDREVNDFRLMMRLMGTEIARDRLAKTWIEKLYYQFPPRLAPTPDVPRNIKSKLRDENIVILVKFERIETTFTFHVQFTITPHTLKVSILNKKANNLNLRGEYPQDYVLRICGREDYLVGDYPLIQFLYIQDCMSKNVTPTLVITSIENVAIEAGNIYETPEDLESKQNRPIASGLTLRKKGKCISSWNIEQPFTCKISAIYGLNCDVNKNIRIQVGLFHGGKSLCETQKTSEIQVLKDETVDIEEEVTFQINVCDIPRMARLCFVVYEIRRNLKGTKPRRIKESKELDTSPLAWVNTTVYDYKSQLKTGAMTLYMWTFAEDMQSNDLLHPLGTVVSNPNREHATALWLSFDDYGQEQNIVYPSTEKLIEYAQLNNTMDINSTPDISNTAPYLESLPVLAESDPLHELHDQERKDAWNHRYYCMKNVPALLPRLLHCVEWNDRYEVCEVTFLLSKWPKLRLEKALELLDYAYADEAVRSFAVSCLKDVSDEELSLYLLQLVQALKHESFLACDLVKFLLFRALNNQKIGHFLFWHLRSEMQMPSVSVRFGLILEAYCWGSPEHIPVLMRQINCLEKLKSNCEQIRQKPNKEKAKAALQELLNEPHCNETIQNVLNPLNPSYRCRRVKPDKCRVMDSKMRPLWIVFENADPFGDDIYIILKNGDDLRQDMLTLQMIRIMDKLWKNEGLDLRMIPYSCISTEHRVGLIEVVLNAETLANIQKEKVTFSAASAFFKGSLLAWLKDHNPTETALNKAVDEFTLSCAGYCVATYVLGVADRHSDNIMVKKTGQLFHIDFGHILGHFKEKFGFRRERVPFVLTYDFVHVINKGKKDALEFQIFQKHCEQAFMILRRHGCLILSLFAMMISTGLPELSSEKDLNYLRDTLVLDLSEQDALAHFRSKFEEALCNSWKTWINWASHNMSKNNKQ